MASEISYLPALRALEDIEPGTPLGYNYGVGFWKTIRRTPCLIDQAGSLLSIPMRDIHVVIHYRNKSDTLRFYRREFLFLPNEPVYYYNNDSGTLTISSNLDAQADTAKRMGGILHVDFRETVLLQTIIDKVCESRGVKWPNIKVHKQQSASVLIIDLSNCDCVKQLREIGLLECFDAHNLLNLNILIALYLTAKTTRIDESIVAALLKRERTRCDTQPELRDAAVQVARLQGDPALLWRFLQEHAAVPLSPPEPPAAAPPPEPPRRPIIIYRQAQKPTDQSSVVGSRDSARFDMKPTS